MLLKIRKTIDPILRESTEPVVNFDHEFQFLVDNMIETMRKNNGVGLAAPQVGISKKVLICEFEGDKESDLPSFPLTVICNPKITFVSKNKRNMVEGCLSFPGLELLIKRPEKVIIEGQDRYGKNIKIDAKDLQSRVLQHETDHLNSTLLIDRIMETKIIFIGTGTLGTKSLELLASDPQYKIVAVITGETKKIMSRGKTTKINPVMDLAKKLNLPIIQTSKINDDKVISRIKALKPKLGIMADFGQIVSEEILNIPKHGIINIHPSLLPKHRGPSPIQQTILDGEEKTGVSLILTSTKMDTGKIITQTVVELTRGETTTTLKKYLGEVSATLLLNSIPYYLAGDFKPIPQNDEYATYTKIFTSKNGYVDENTEAVEVERKIRAFDSWPKVYTIIDEKRLQLLSSHFEENGEFAIDRVKPEGKKEMSYEEYIRGHKKRLTFK